MEIMMAESSVSPAETWSDRRNAAIAQLIHKLKSPVTAITIYVELLHRLEGSALTEQVLLYLDKLRSANGEVKRIVEQWNSYCIFPRCNTPNCPKPGSRETFSIIRRWDSTSGM